MNTDPGIIYFNHCNRSIYCFNGLEYCPVCGEELRDIDLQSEPVRITYMFVRANQTPCAVLLKPTSGSFLRNYKFNDDLHVGITTSKSTVVEYDSNGIQDTNTDHWTECLIMKQLNDISWSKHWDLELKKIVDSNKFTAEKYDEDTFNCYTFILSFINNLKYKPIKDDALSKELFCQNVIAPRLKDACNYIYIYRTIEKNTYYLKDDDRPPKIPS